MGNATDLCSAGIPHDPDFDTCTSCAEEILGSVSHVDSVTADIEGLPCILCTPAKLEYGTRLREEPHDLCVSACLDYALAQS